MTNDLVKPILKRKIDESVVSAFVTKYRSIRVLGCGKLSGIRTFLAENECKA